MNKNGKQLAAWSTKPIAFLFLISCGTGQVKEAAYGEAGQHQPIMVFAGAGLTDVLSEIIDSFEILNPIKVQTNMASSGTLARQIEQGADPDIFISASTHWADYVDSLGYILPGTKVPIAKNELVLIAALNSSVKVAAIDSSLDFMSLLGKYRLSMGDPAHVPAGSYAKESLEYYGWFDKLEGKILPAKDVRSALMVVEFDEAPLGIVYHTDAQKSDKVIILGTFPETSHKPIVYVGGLCKENDMAKVFFEYLTGNASQTIWAKHGFK
jgi:molybdate transport system substrate-binding protein